MMTIKELVEEVGEVQAAVNMYLHEIIFELTLSCECEESGKFKEAADSIDKARSEWFEIDFLIASIGRKIKRKRKESKQWQQK